MFKNQSEKTCIKCGISKSTGDFYWNSHTCLYMNVCKLCHCSVTKITRKNYHKEKKLKVYQLLGSRCTCCGEATIEFLTIDHMNGDGGAHRRFFKMNTGAIYSLILKSGIDGFRLLCWNCNSSRGIHGYCPHEKVGQK